MNKKIMTAVTALGLMTAMTACSTAAETTTTTTTTGESKITAAESSETTTTEESKETSASEADPVDVNRDLTAYILSDSDSASQMAEKIEKKYGVDIVYGDEIRTVFDDAGDDIHAEKYTKEDGIKVALKSVDEALAVFPQGLIEQLSYGGKGILKIYLTGAIAKGSEKPAPGAYPAFTTDDDEELYLTIDISMDGIINVPTVSHELTHVIDFKLHDLGLIDEDEWNKLNPEGFKYVEDYSKFKQSEFIDKYSYCSEHYIPRLLTQPDDQVYFYYNYSIVNAYEDRATLMEDLITYKMWGNEIAPGLYKFEHVKAKAEYLLDKVKQAFTLNESDLASWKKAWNEIS